MSPYFQQLRSKVGRDLLLLPCVAAVIRDELGRILLQEKSSGEGWSLPAGAIEPGETPEQAVRREVREETGLEVAPREILSVFGGSGMAPTLASLIGRCRTATCGPASCRLNRGQVEPGQIEPNRGQVAHAPRTLR